MYQAKRTIPLLSVFSFTLFACTQPAQDPAAIADKYWNNLLNGNNVEAEKLVSSNSRYAFSELTERTATIKKVTNSAALTTVRTTITTTDPDSNVIHKQSFDTVLVLEEGQWKVDVKHSQIPPDEDLSESMKKSLESIDHTMTQGMQMLNDALREGSEEMGDSLMNLMNELNSAMQQSIDKLEQRRQQQEQQLQQEQVDPQSGEGMI